MIQHVLSAFPMDDFDDFDIEMENSFVILGLVKFSTIKSTKWLISKVYYTYWGKRYGRL